jgi:hypothetical protein
VHDVDARLAPVHVMLSMLPFEQKESLARRLHDQLFAPAGARERRVSELGFLAALLDQTPQPPERLPVIERQDYEARREAERPTATRAALLVERYGSWRRACWAAWGLLADGRKAMGGSPRPHVRPYEGFTKPAVDAVRACADAIGRAPSTRDYKEWADARRRKARDRGATPDVPSYNAVLRTLAPDRKNRNGWRLVTSRVFDSRREGVPRREVEAPPPL